MKITPTQLDDLIKEAGFATSIPLGYPSVNVYNDKAEMIGIMYIRTDYSLWFSVYDTIIGDITLEGGGCLPTAESIRNIISEFSYR